MSQRFAKYEGLGNDFIIIEGPKPENAAETVRKWCDRHFGVGADGVLFVHPEPGVRARMSVVNADGSEPEMCGNGLRCVALHLALTEGVKTAQYSIATLAGILKADVEREGDGGQVRLTMGRAEVLGEQVFTTDGVRRNFLRVSMGNPHAITFESELDPVIVDRVGPEVSRSVPGGSNVEFVQVDDDGTIDLVVWERGVGRTLACGTGAAAAAAALAVTGRFPFDQRLEVRLPGGPLSLWVHSDRQVELEGPARRVFVGEIPGSI